MGTRKYILMLASALFLGYASASNAFALESIKAKDSKVAVTSTINSVEVKQQFENAHQQYEQLKMDLQRQAFDVIVLKERLDKSTRVLEVYRESADDQNFKQDIAWADENYKEATASYQRGVKELEDMKAKLVVAEIGLEKVLVKYNLSMGK